MTTDALDRAIARHVSAAELRHELEREISTDERDDVLSLVRWFTHRYQSAEARLAYVRRAHARWRRGRG